jgi:hypothetical protein
MKPSEILRSLADMIDARQQAIKPLGASGALNPRLMPQVIAEPVDVEFEPANGLAQQPDDVFVPPLQLKIELLKKSQGVENIYDDPEEEEDEAHHYDELAAIKRNAGIAPIVLDALDDDEPLG